jgi:uncharacterized protein YecE (DUF72 family)
MSQTHNNYYVGTAGYSHSNFYSVDIEPKQYFDIYKKIFNIVEINNTFYKAPTPDIIKKWYTNSPANFKFVIKLHKYYTHNKRLKLDKSIKLTLKNFLTTCIKLESKLAAILIQLPPNFIMNDVNYARLVEFIKFFKSNKKFANINFAFEFRHKSFHVDKVWTLLKKSNMVFVIHDFNLDTINWSSFAMIQKIITSNSLIYVRLHGTKLDYKGAYSKKYLHGMIICLNKFKKYDVCVIFNNTDEGQPACAITNALALNKMIK